MYPGTSPSHSLSLPISPYSAIPHLAAILRRIQLLLNRIQCILPSQHQAIALHLDFIAFLRHFIRLFIKYLRLGRHARELDVDGHVLLVLHADLHLPYFVQLGVVLVAYVLLPLLMLINLLFRQLCLLLQHFLLNPPFQILCPLHVLPQLLPEPRCSLLLEPRPQHV